jgi:phosphonate transport system substrate-binding protein
VVQPAPLPALPSALDQARVLTLGTIDAYEPRKQIERFQPLADYLAANLQDQGIEQGRVMIARDFYEMAQLLEDGKVDLYLDSPFPTLKVQSLSRSRPVLLRWKGGAGEYWSTYLVRRDSGISDVMQLAGRVLAMEEPYSTSGYLLPIGHLVLQGIKVREVTSPQAIVRSDEVGYYFTSDQQNSVELVLRGLVTGAGVSNQDYDKLDSGLKQELVTVGQTATVPRSLVSVRPGLEQALLEQVVTLLVLLDDTEAGRLLLEQADKTNRFEALTTENVAAVADLQRMMSLLPR